MGRVANDGSRGDRLRHPNRAGQSQPIIVALLAMILLALLGLIYVFGGREPPRRENETSASASDSKHASPVPPPPNEDRIRETAQAGKTYHSVLKAGLTARIEDKDWGIRSVCSLTFATEFVVDRKVESNDGKRIIELRTFPKARCAKLLYSLDDLSLDLGVPNELILGALDSLAPGTSQTVAFVGPIVKSIVGQEHERVVQTAGTKVIAQIESIQGKSVRIVFEAGKGVQSLEPVGCSLTSDERNYLMGTALLSDYYIMPDVDIPVGGTWSISGAELANLIDPSWHGRPSGTVLVRRDSDSQAAGSKQATLRVESGVIHIDESDNTTQRIGSFTPTGQLRYSIPGKYTESADLKGDIKIEQISKNHLLFEAVFRFQPKLQIQYSCRMQ